MTGNQSESIQPTQYFVQCEVDGSCYAFYRKRYEANGLFEECWQVEAKKWVSIPGRIIWIRTVPSSCTAVGLAATVSQRIKSCDEAGRPSCLLSAVISATVIARSVIDREAVTTNGFADA